MRNCVFIVLINCGLAAASFAQATDGPAFFEKNVRPLLVARCLGCHSAATAPAGGLRLDTHEGLQKGGARGPAVVAGAPEQSLLLKAIRHTEGVPKMPPGPKLKDAEVALLTQWVAMGAPWGQANAAAAVQKFWAFTPPTAPAIPAVKNKDWVKSPIDAFILSALEAKGLTPAAPADKRTLIRRATYDLTGLPPTPEEVRNFLEDASPNAFSKVVDRLLASPHYGERWGRHWLDIARYADSNGLDENLVYKNAYRYRDYVIQAFNKDKPYDLFLKEQLAGDLLPESRDLKTQFERWTATGFLSLGAKMLAEDDPLKMEMDIVDEQLDTTARAFMGMTVGCARCHDHKFDPIPTADYYALAGIFKSSKTMENFQVVAKWHEYVLADKPQRDQLQAHLDKISAKQKEIGKISKQHNDALAAQGRQQAGDYLLAAGDVLRYAQIELKPVLDASAAKPATSPVVLDAGAFVRGNVSRKLEKKSRNVAADQKGPYFAEYEVEVPQAGDYQLDMLEEETGNGTADVWVNGVLMKRGATPIQNRAASPDAGGWSVTGIFALTAGRNTIRLEHKARFPYFEKLLMAPPALKPGSETPRTLEQVSRQYRVNPGFLAHWVDELEKAKGAPHSVLLAWLEYGKPLTAWTSPAAAFFRDGDWKTRQQLAARYQNLFAEADRQWQAVKDKADPKAALADAGYEALRQLAYEKAGPFRAPDNSRQYFAPEVQQQLAALDAERKQLEDSTPDLPHAMGVREGDKIADLKINIRGSHWTLGAEVPRGFLRAVHVQKAPAVSTQSSGRLELAEWLTQPDHPLTSRVMANRLWRWHFGRGIVPSVDNFGRLGEAPTNQPLLDWLALQFVDQGWSMKQMHRLMMLSSTYQMSTAYNERAFETDPENKLLWRANRRRLEAEALRDGIMAASGDLDLTAGGSLMTYKDRQYVSDTAKRGGMDYERNRRAVYIPIVRSSMYDVFQAFDLPDPSTSNGDRSSTVVAPQALFVMNGAVALRHSRTLAEKLLARSDWDDAARIREAYERALGRPPLPAEIDRALTLIGTVDRQIADRQKDPSARRAFAWQSFVKALMASNEFIYLN